MSGVTFKLLEQCSAGGYNTKSNKLNTQDRLQTMKSAGNPAVESQLRKTKNWACGSTHLYEKPNKSLKRTHLTCKEKHGGVYFEERLSALPSMFSFKSKQHQIILEWSDLQAAQAGDEFRAQSLIWFFTGREI